MTAYATPAQLVTYGMPATALGTLTVAQQNAALEAASRVVDSYLRGRYALPLTAWGVEITDATCKLAAWELLNVRGYNPSSGADVNVQVRADGARAWLEGVQRARVHPDVTPAASQVPTYSQPTIITSSAAYSGSASTSRTRGW